MTRPSAFSVSLCSTLFAAILALQACKHAPLAPDLSTKSNVDVSEDEQAAIAELKRLEDERAELLAEQQQLEADIRLAETGWPEGGEAPILQEEVKYGSNGKPQHDDITEAKKEINKCTKKGDRIGAKNWFKKLKDRCKNQKEKVSTKVVDVDVKIGKVKSQYPYAGVVPGPVQEPGGSGAPEFQPPAQDRSPVQPKPDTPYQNDINVENKNQNTKY